MNKENEILLVTVCKIAAGHGWSCSHHNEWMVSFYRDEKEGRQRINVYWDNLQTVKARIGHNSPYSPINFTVQTALNHPTKGKTQLNRRGITEAELKLLFTNPRHHLGKGYYKTKS